MRYLIEHVFRRESRPMIRRYSANVRLSNLGSPVSNPLRSASRARAVRTWLDVLCSTDSKLAIRASMNSSISRRSGGLLIGLGS